MRCWSGLHGDLDLEPLTVVGQGRSAIYELEPSDRNAFCYQSVLKASLIRTFVGCMEPGHIPVLVTLYTTFLQIAITGKMKDGGWTIFGTDLLVQLETLAKSMQRLALNLIKQVRIYTTLVDQFLLAFELNQEAGCV